MFFFTITPPIPRFFTGTFGEGIPVPLKQESLLFLIPLLITETGKPIWLLLICLADLVLLFIWVMKKFILSTKAFIQERFFTTYTMNLTTLICLGGATQTQQNPVLTN